MRLNKNSAALTDHQEQQGFLDDYSLMFITSLLRVQWVADNMPYVPSQLWSRHVFRHNLCFSMNSGWWSLTPHGSRACHPVPDACCDKSVDASCIVPDLGRINTGKSKNKNWIMSWDRVLSPKWVHFNFFGNYLQLTNNKTLWVLVAGADFQTWLLRSLEFYSPAKMAI